MNVWKESDGRWRYAYYDENGKRVKKRVPRDLPNTKKSAKAMLAEAMVRVNQEKALAESTGEVDLEKSMVVVTREPIAEDKEPETSQEEKSDLTVHKILDDYIESGKKRLKSGSRLPPIARALYQFFPSDLLATDLKRSQVEEYQSWRLKQPYERKGVRDSNRTTLRPATVNREVAMLRAAYNRAIQDELLERNPVRFVKMLPEKNKRDFVLSDEKFERLMEELPQHIKPIVQLAWESGARRGEIMSLEWEHVDLDKKQIQLQETKNDETRTIPLTDSMVEVLRGIKQRNKDEKINSPYVWLVKRRNRWVRINEFRRTWITATKEAGIEGFHFHDLRHCFITRMRRADVRDTVIMKISGHKTYSAFVRYDTADPEEIHEALDQITAPKK